MELPRDVTFLSCMPDKDNNGSCDQEEFITDTSRTLVCEQNNSSAEIILDIGSPSRELDFLLTLDPLQGWVNPLTGEKNRDCRDVQEVETAEEFRDNCAAIVDAEQKSVDKPVSGVQEQFVASKSKHLYNLLQFNDGSNRNDDVFSCTSTDQVASSVNGSAPPAASSHKGMQHLVLLPLVLHNSLAVSNVTVINESTQKERDDTSFLKNFEGVLNATCQDDASVHRTTMNLHRMGSILASIEDISHKLFSVNNYSEEGLMGRDFPGLSSSKSVSVPMKYKDAADVCGDRIHCVAAFLHPDICAPLLQNGKTCEETGSSFQADGVEVGSNEKIGESWEDDGGKPPSPNHVLKSRIQKLAKRRLCLDQEAKEMLKKRKVSCLSPIVPDKACTPVENSCCPLGNMCTSAGTSNSENLAKTQIAVPFKVVQYFDKVFITEEAKCKTQEENEMERLHEIERKSKENVSRAMSKVTKLAARYGGYNVPVKGKKGVFFCRKKDFSKKTLRQLLMSCSNAENLEKDNLETFLCEDSCSESHTDRRNMNRSLPERPQGAKSLNMENKQEEGASPEEPFVHPKEGKKCLFASRKREPHQEEGLNDQEDRNLADQEGYHIIYDDTHLSHLQKSDFKAVADKISSLGVERESCHQTGEDVQPLSEEGRSQGGNGAWVKQGGCSVAEEDIHNVHKNAHTLTTDLAGTADEVKEQHAQTASPQVPSDQDNWMQGSTSTVKEPCIGEFNDTTVRGQNDLSWFDPPVGFSSPQICSLSVTEKSGFSSTSSTCAQTDLNGTLESNAVDVDQLRVVEKWTDSQNTTTVQSCKKEELTKNPFILIMHETSELPKNLADNPEKSSPDVGNLIGVQHSCNFWQKTVEDTHINQAQTICKASNTKGYCSVIDQLDPCLTSETASVVISGETNCSFSTYLDIEDLREFPELNFCYQEDPFNKISGTVKADRKEDLGETQYLTPEERNGSPFEDCSHRLNIFRDAFGADDNNLSDVHSDLPSQVVDKQKDLKNNQKTYVQNSLQLADPVIEAKNDCVQKMKEEVEDQVSDTDNQCKDHSSMSCAEEVQGESMLIDIGVPVDLNHTKCEQNPGDNYKHIQDECVSSIRELYLEQDQRQVCKHSTQQESPNDLLIDDGILAPTKKHIIPPVSYSDPLDIWIEESPYPTSSHTPFFSKSDIHVSCKDDWLEMDYSKKTSQENPRETTFFPLDCDFLLPDSDEGFTKQLGDVLVKCAEQMSHDIRGLHEQAAESVSDCLQDTVACASVDPQQLLGSESANTSKGTSSTSSSVQLSFIDLQTDFTFLRALSSSPTTMISNSSVSKDRENCNDNLGEKVHNCSAECVEDNIIGKIHGSSHNKVRIQSSETPLMDVDLKVASNGSTPCMADLDDSLKTAFFQQENPVCVGATSTASWPLCVQHESNASQPLYMQDKNTCHLPAMTNALQTSVQGSSANFNICSDSQCSWSAVYPAKVVTSLIGVGELCVDVASLPALYSYSTDNNHDHSHLENPQRTESLVLRHSSNLTANTNNTGCFFTPNESSCPLFIPAVSTSSLPPSKSVIHSAAVSDSLPSSFSPVTSWSSSKFLVTHVPTCQYNPPCPCHPPSIVCSGSERGAGHSVACVPFHPSMLDYQYMYAHPAALACPSDQVQTPSVTQSGLHKYDPIARDYHIADKCSGYTYKRKNRIVTRGSIPTRQFSIRGLRIGSFVFSSDEETKSANSNKLKLTFSKRTLSYEMKIRRCADSPYKLVVVAIHFDSIVGLWGRDKSFLIEVNAIPEIYINRSSQKSLDNDLDEPVDITGGNIKSVPYHYVYLSCSNENTVKHYLCMDQYLRKLLVKSVTVDPDRTLCQNQITGKDSLEKNRILSVTACRCKGSCSYRNCECHRKNQKCSEACTCVCLKNLLKTLDLLGLSMQSIQDKACLMSCIRVGKNLKNLLKKTVTLECCGIQITLRHVGTGSFVCPNCSAAYKFSWCLGKLHSETSDPQHHCELCGLCVDAALKHCQTCKRCVMVDRRGECLWCLEQKSQSHWKH